ncbi:CHAP domain-containing protein [Actinomadura mexicana]|uniref:CHAP domain-containing protein n=1 Tax=Actinomadura mexicana TaxID=134959 RepID=A0A239GYB7_9ACTN|nr:CHAP domain-containing protein [Actinomadura mexicana]SNS73865.1 CHAP domain-containing protein [Actinomadura mexicana]
MNSRQARSKQTGPALATALFSATLTTALATGPAASASTTATGWTITQANPTAQTAPQKVPGTDIASGADKSSPAAAVVRLANSQVGYHEKGNNCTKYGKWAHHDCSQWCDIFVGWVFSNTGQLKAVGGKVYPGVDDHIKWFENHKRFHHRGAKGGGPHPGDVIFFDFNGHDGADHVGIVVGYDATHVTTVEGNRGDQVKKLTYSRYSRFIWGYGSPAW